MTYPVLSGQKLATYSASIYKGHYGKTKSRDSNKYTIESLMQKALYISGEQYVNDSIAKSVIKTYHVLNNVQNPERIGYLTAKFSNYLNELEGIGFPNEEKIGDFIDYIYGKANQLIESPYGTGTKDIVIALLDMLEDIEPIYIDLSKNLNVLKRILSYVQDGTSVDLRTTKTYEGIKGGFMDIRGKDELPKAITTGRFITAIANFINLVERKQGKLDGDDAGVAIGFIDQAIFESEMFKRKYARYNMIRGKVDRIFQH